MTASRVQSHSNTRPPSLTTDFQSCVPELTAVLTILRHVEVRVNGLLQAFAHYRVLCTVFSLAEDHGAAKKTCLETYLLVFEKTILLVSWKSSPKMSILSFTTRSKRMNFFLLLNTKYILRNVTGSQWLFRLPTLFKISSFVLNK